MSKRYRNKKNIERNRAGNVYYGPQGIQGNPLGYIAPGRYGTGNNVTIPAQIVAQMLEHMAPQKQQANEFAPGSPLQPYAGVVPFGGPRVWSYAPGYNLNPNDRTLGQNDIPTFQQLRSFAQLYEGISLAERVVLDLIPKLKPKVGVRRDLIAQGARVKDYQDAIKRWMPFVEMPDRAQKMDIHSWLRMAWTEQTQIDALSIYKQKDRSGRLYGLQIIDGSTVKPLLNERGMVPLPPYPAYQQYPYGVPGDEYTTEHMLYYRESPRAYSPYGFSRVERIITRVNQALRKEQKDLARFTEGNVPAGMMEVPDTSTWTPDQIDAYEQAWNALMAGSQQQQVRIRFTQPGMKYTQFEDPINAANVTEFDMFLLNVTLGCYGLGMGDIGFTEDIHKSAGDSQENMMYRRTLYPTISIYSRMLTSILVEAFGDEELEITFGGFEEIEDMQMQSEAYSRLIEHAVISPAQVARIMGLPEIPETGPFISSPGAPPLFLDTLADQNFRQSITDAHIDTWHTANASQSQSDEAGTSQSAGVAHSVSRIDAPSEPHSDAIIEGSQRGGIVQPSGLTFIGNGTPELIHIPEGATATPTLSLVEKQLAELLERFETFSKRMIQVPTGENHDQIAQASQRAEDGTLDDLGGGDQQTSPQQERGSLAQFVSQGADSETTWNEREDLDATKERKVDIRRWRQTAINDIKRGKPQRGFISDFIPAHEYALISEGLKRCNTTQDVRNVFELVRSSIDEIQSQESGKVSRMGTCQCDICKENHGKSVQGEQPPYHEGCDCRVEVEV